MNKVQRKNGVRRSYCRLGGRRAGEQEQNAAEAVYRWEQLRSGSRKIIEL